MLASRRRALVAPVATALAPQVRHLLRPPAQAHSRGALVAVLLTAFAATSLVLPPAAHAADTSAPRLQSFSVADPDVTADSTVRVDYVAVDDTEGPLRSVVFEYYDPLGGGRQVRGDSGVGQSGAVFAPVSADWPSGTYTLRQVSLVDFSGNLSTYRRSGEVSTTPDGPTAHSLDFTAGDFRVSGTTADAAAPTLKSFAVFGKQARPGSTITIDYGAADDSGQTLSTVEFIYVNRVGGRSGISEFDDVPLSGTIEEVVPQSWPAGTWTLTAVRLVDASRNSSQYNRDGTVTVGPSGASGPARHSFSLATGDFSVTGSADDTTMPALHAVGVEEAIRTRGHAVTVTYSASDDSQRLSRIVFAYQNSFGRSYEIAQNFEPPPSGTISRVVGDDWPSGEYTLQQVSVYDAGGNVATYGRDGTVYKSPSGASGPTRHTVSLAVADFRVDDGGTRPSDSGPPQLVSFDFTPKSVDVRDGSAQVTVTARVTDETGVELPFVEFDSDETDQAAGIGRMTLVSGDVQDGVYRRTITIPQGAASGTWSAVLRPLRDRLGSSGVAGPPAEFPRTLQVQSGAPQQPAPSPSPSEQPSPSPSPTPSEQPSPSPSPSPSTAPSEPPSEAPSEPPPAAGPAARSIDDACPEGQVPANRFTDVVTGSTHERAISCLVWWEVANGRTATTYAPSDGVTRDAMAAFVARAIGKAAPGSLPDAPPDAFGDDDTSVHETAINQLAAVGIIGGTGGGAYTPGAVVTRGQMAKFLANAAQHVLGRALPADRDLFRDDDTSPFHDDINRIAGAGLAGGRSDGTYDPTGRVTREQMGSFLARLLDLLVDNGAQRPA